MLNVVAGIIHRNDEILICKRPPHKKQPLLWEFPGGKIEVGETAFQALKRELQEELNIDVKIYDILEQTVHHYEDYSVNLMFINCEIISGIPKNLEHEEIKWVNILDLSNYEFCPADVEVLEKLKR